MILSNIKGFFKKNKRVFIYITLFFAFSFIFSDFSFAGNPAHAGKAGSTSTTTSSTSTDSGNIKGSGNDSTAQGIADAVNQGLGVVALFTGLLTWLATLFLSPEWINGSLFGMNEKLHTIWIMVSNIVYFIFAFLLIWIAFMNIIGKNADQYQLKQALPKFIVGILIVPFSWFLVQFILSISSILTISAVSLPYDSFPKYSDFLNKLPIPKNCTINLTSANVSSTDGKSANKGKFIDCGEDGEEETITFNELFKNGTSSSAIYGVLAFYTHGVMGIDNTSSIKDKEIKGVITSVVDIAMKLIFDILFIFIYFILLVALGLVLMIRGIYIWIYMMLSPVFGLMYFFDKKDGGDGFFSKFNLKEFIALAMVPVYTMLALSFGMLFIYIVGTGLVQKGSTGITNFKILPASDGKSTMITIGGGDNSDNKLTYTIKGAFGSSSEFYSKLGDGGNQALGYVGMLILKIFGIVVLWGSVMAAMRTSQITKTIVEPLHQFGTKVGQIATSAPGNIPVFGGQSMKSMGQIATSAGSYIDTKSRDRGTDFLKRHNLFQSGTTDLTNKSLNATTVLSKDTSLTKTGAEEYKKAFDAGKNVQELSKNKQFIDATKMIADKLKLDKNTIEKIKLGMSASDLSKVLGDIDHKISMTHSSFGVDLIGGVNRGGGSITMSEINNYKESLASGSNSGTNNSDIKPEFISDKNNSFIYKVDGTRIEVLNKDGKQTITDNTSLEKLARLIQGGLNKEKFTNEILSNMGITDSNEIKEVMKSVSGKLYKNDKGELSLVKLDGYDEIKDGKIWGTN